MINWIDRWSPGCWCFDRRPLFADQRRSKTFNYDHAWIWFLWAPRDEAKPHVIPTAWGFENGPVEPAIHDLAGTDPVYGLAANEADWAYLCDVLFACDDMTPPVRTAVKALREEYHRINLQRLADAFESVDSEDFTMFMECTLLNTVEDPETDQTQFFMHAGQLYRQCTPAAKIELFDVATGAFVYYAAPSTGKSLGPPLTQRVAIAFITNANKKRKLTS